MTVSRVVVVKNGVSRPILLDDNSVRRISAFLLPNDVDAVPGPLVNNRGTCFTGLYPRGAGFLFDDDDSDASPIALIERILERNPGSSRAIRPYLIGEDFLNDPQQQHSRFVIYVGEDNEDDVHVKWPELINIL